ncbi:ribonuclease 3-like protein 2 isoform X2 [Lolium perenne]|uniref:ribonuclease 3-like protein 2 isoform X2 n=1 Tax=Lolium perenne TaxID=4522 RepID=UPI0021F5FA11|nr:ribonuclease 3-like protein 2 [Lolium perenne]
MFPIAPDTATPLNPSKDLKRPRAEPGMKPGSRKRASLQPDPVPVTLALPGFVADRSEAAARVERLLQYQFHDRSLLEEALTHQSFADAAASYQRLEFVGDAVLGLAFSNFLYLTNPTLGPGALSSLRAANISTEKLARVAVRHDFYPLLRRNCPRLDLMVGQFTESVKQELEDDLGTAPYGGSVVKAPKVLADIVEAIAAAVYVDCTFNLVKLWQVTRFLFEPIITAETIDEQPVSTLHELCQKHGKVAQFKTWQKGGTTVANVFVDGTLVGMGSSEQRVIAKLNAARDAVGKLLGEAKQQVLTTGVGHVSGVEVGELRECKQKLHEQCIMKRWSKPIYKLEKEDGPAHDRKFLYSVQVQAQGHTYVTLGEPFSRVKDAENSGAQEMLKLLSKQVAISGE